MGMRLLTARNTWRRLGGFGHLPQYTANKSGLGSSNGSDVLNRFAHFKFFAGPTTWSGGDTAGQAICFRSVSSVLSV